ncbi:PilZ domain-containing protein [Sphingomicrobium lutaoense]|uniref:PilZ domain-containing protein n=1 Tax=Sphingomicrobium lutaoense TaxID=515949 RepID=A0A839Z2Y3_9SPHN|nr:PilZ domain-containing protein [Sphingomicrobium lutaoense]MBB3763945.1 hypothetical protein [Sphingomicrobium lutaoense]
MDESNPNQNRRQQRSQVLMTAQLELSGTTRDVKLRNLSAEGALVEGEGLPVEGSELIFRKGAIKAPGRIAWVNNNRAGIAFATSLHPDELLRHVPRPKPRIEPRFQRPPIRNGDLTPAERRAAENWVWSDPIEPLKR